MALQDHAEKEVISVTSGQRNSKPGNHDVGIRVSGQFLNYLNQTTIANWKVAQKMLIHYMTVS
jgi:hypothetical protein